MTISDKPATCITYYEMARWNYIANRDREIPAEHPQQPEHPDILRERHFDADAVLDHAIKLKEQQA